MIGLQYELSIPKYVASKIYHSASKKLPAVFPNLHLRKNLADPKLNGPTWVKLKTLMCGICGSDQNMLRGHESFSMEPYASFPCVMGHENVAKVEEVGTAVSDVKVGDVVVVNPVMGCKVHDRSPECSMCAKGLDALCEKFADTTGLGAGMSLGYHKCTGGGWAEYFQAHKWQIHKVPPGVSVERAVLTDPFSSAMAPVAELAATRGKEKLTVLVYGAGTIGLLCVASIKALKLPWKIILGYRYEFQGTLGKEFGADVIVKTGKKFNEALAKEVGSTVRKVSIGKPVMEGGVDAVFDCVGSPQTIDDSLRFCKTGGNVLLVATSNSLNGVDPAPIWFREIKLTGTCMSRNATDPRDGKQKQIYQMVLESLPTVAAEKLLTHTFSVKDYKRALRKSMDKKGEPVIKVAFKWD